MKTSLLGRIVRVADNLFRDPDSGRYYGVKKVGGKRKLHSHDTTDRVTANGKQAAWLRELDAADAGAVDLKFEALLQKFMAVRKGMAAGTFETEQGIAATLRRGFGVPMAGEPAYASKGMATVVRGGIKTSDLARWLSDEARRKGWGGAYYNRCRFFLRQLFDVALADGIVSEATNPFKPKLIPTRRVAKTKRNIPTLEQFAAIVADVRARRDNPDCEQSADFLAFQGLAGIGQAEVASLGRFSVSDSGIIRLSRVKTGRDFSFPVYEWLAPLIEKLSAVKKFDGKRQLSGPYGEGGKFFSMRDGKKALGRACARLGLPHFTQRNLRAVCIKRLYDLGIDVKQIALWQGHNDGGKLIQCTYTEVFSADTSVAEAANMALVTGRKVVKFAAA